MSWTRIYIHLVFRTKHSFPYLSTKELRNEVFSHIRENALSKGIHAHCVNGYSDHAHCLLTLHRDQTISKVAQLLKGESAYWINKNSLMQYQFKWQDDYWAVGIGQHHFRNLRRYIENQEEHHKTRSFSEELEELNFDCFARD